MRLRFETLLCHILLCQICASITRFLLLCYYSRNSNFYYLGWGNGLSLVKSPLPQCSNNYFIIDEWNKCPLQNWYLTDSTRVKRYVCTRKVSYFMGWHGQLSVLRKSTNTPWVAWSLWHYAPTFIHVQEKAGNQLQEILMNTKKIFRWLNCDHVLTWLCTFLRFSTYYIILAMYACELWNCGLLFNTRVVRKYL